jgi:hypothetical protein
MVKGCMKVVFGMGNVDEKQRPFMVKQPEEG